MPPVGPKTTKAPYTAEDQLTDLVYGGSDVPPPADPAETPQVSAPATGEGAGSQQQLQVAQEQGQAPPAAAPATAPEPYVDYTVNAGQESGGAGTYGTPTPATAPASQPATSQTDASTRGPGPYIPGAVEGGMDYTIYNPTEPGLRPINNDPYGAYSGVQTLPATGGNNWGDDLFGANRASATSVHPPGGFQHGAIGTGGGAAGGMLTSYIDDPLYQTDTYLGMGGHASDPAVVYGQQPASDIRRLPATEPKPSASGYYGGLHSDPYTKDIDPGEVRKTTLYPRDDYLLAQHQDNPASVAAGQNIPSTLASSLGLLPEQQNRGISSGDDLDRSPVPDPNVLGMGDLAMIGTGPGGLSLAAEEGLAAKEATLAGRFGRGVRRTELPGRPGEVSPIVDSSLGAQRAAEGRAAHDAAMQRAAQTGSDQFADIVANAPRPGVGSVQTAQMPPRTRAPRPATAPPTTEPTITGELSPFGGYEGTWDPNNPWASGELSPRSRAALDAAAAGRNRTPADIAASQDIAAQEAAAERLRARMGSRPTSAPTAPRVQPTAPQQTANVTRGGWGIRRATGALAVGAAGIGAIGQASEDDWASPFQDTPSASGAAPGGRTKSPGVVGDPWDGQMVGSTEALPVAVGTAGDGTPFEVPAARKVILGDGTAAISDPAPISQQAYDAALARGEEPWVLDDTEFDGLVAAGLMPVADVEAARAQLVGEPIMADAQWVAALRGTPVETAPTEAAPADTTTTDTSTTKVYPVNGATAAPGVSSPISSQAPGVAPSTSSSNGGTTWNASGGGSSRTGGFSGGGTSSGGFDGSRPSTMPPGFYDGGSRDGGSPWDNPIFDRFFERTSAAGANSGLRRSPAPASMTDGRPTGRSRKRRRGMPTSNRRARSGTVSTPRQMPTIPTGSPSAQDALAAALALRDR